MGIGFDRGRAVIGQAIEVVAELEVGLHDLLPGDGLPGVAGGAAHERGKVGIDPALQLVMRPVLADALNEVVPFVLPGTVLVLGRSPGDVAPVDALILEQVDGGGVGQGVEGRNASTGR